MQNSISYTISVLNDFSRLNEVHSLVHDAFVDAGLCPKKTNNLLNLYPHLNRIEETKIIIAEKDGKIIGTNSVTVDGEYGLHTDSYFKEETDLIRKESTNKIGSSWRIATDKNYRNNIGLLLDIIRKTVEIIIEMDIETCLYSFSTKHEKFYKKLLNAETIAESDVFLKEGLKTRSVLMKTNATKTINHLNKTFFNKRKI